ncbi:class I SAM-dependent methyltransferase [Chromohalobacter canadensis]|uniref:O-methyltransferase n=1 Tax=Chromohalobacter canadensis TaxID=141389 RepID=UPI0021C216E7|nr:class I SAM-dependent methyltransferase [Chromohalobacter canadensis]MCT8467685.1 class I SAM-dependent methyltransferase [Chromohalobacter canadensis]MCT8470567.1 class I SAM-dependent methyltransferase [Chromohalobacter canadensis]MCT8498182.1 class I SAM-dependent methyltransferase [Chromohalobacter canadensis]
MSTFDPRLDMDDAMRHALALYHQRIEEEKQGNGGPHRHMAVGPATGRLINLLASSLDAPHILELGTSLGYSTLWLADAARATGGRVTTIELEAEKSTIAKEMAAGAGLTEWVDYQVGDALALLDDLDGPFDFVLVDHWKDLYLPSFEAFRDKLAPGAILVADNMIRGGGGDSSGQAEYAAAVRAMPGMTSVLLPVGSGLEVSRYEPAQ